jgi:hypothetical protein
MGRLVVDVLTRNQLRRRRRRLLRLARFAAPAPAIKAAGWLATEPYLGEVVQDALAEAYGKHFYNDFYKKFDALNLDTDRIGMLVDKTAAILKRAFPPVALPVEEHFHDPANPMLNFQAFLQKMKKDETLGGLSAALTPLAHY